MNYANKNSASKLIYMITKPRSYHRLSTYVTPYRKMLTLALFSMAVSALSLLTLPALVMQFFDNSFTNKNSQASQLTLLTIITLFVVRGLINHFSSCTTSAIGSQISKDLRLEMFNKLLTLSIPFQLSLTKDDLITHFISDLDQLREILVNLATILIKDFLTVAGLLIWMFYLNWELSLLILLLIALTTLAVQMVNEHLDNIRQKKTKVTFQVIQALHASIKNIKTIRLNGGQSEENHYFASRIKEIDHFNANQTTAKTLGIALAQIVSVIILTVIIALASKQIASDQIIPAELATFILATLLLAVPLKQVSLAGKYWQQGIRVLANIFSLLDQEAEVDTGTVAIKRTQVELTFDNVNFYSNAPAQPTLININFTVKPGEIMVLAGANKNSRTALIDLILRSKSPTSGKLLIDGHNIETLNLVNLYAKIALITPKPVLRHDTVAANISYGYKRCSSETRITAAAQASHAIKFIREMPEGLQTLVGGYKVELNDCQRQHIAIARAILKDPAIVIIDLVCTADFFASKDLKAALETLTQGRTTLVITRHLSHSWLPADRIITL